MIEVVNCYFIEEREAAEVSRILLLEDDEALGRGICMALARVNARLRRSAPANQDRVELSGFIFDFSRLEYSKDGGLIDLSRTEQRLLRLLV